MVISDDKAFFVCPRGSGMTTKFIDKLISSITPQTSRRIAIISSNSSAFYLTLIYALREQGFSGYVEYKTQNSIKILNNWIHVISPNLFSDIRGKVITDMYIQDYDDMSPESKEKVLSVLPLYSKDVLWIWGTKLNDEFINPVIKNGYKNYLLGNSRGMKFYHNYQEDVEELHKRIK